MAAPRHVLGLDPGHHAIKAVLASANGKKLRVQRIEHIPLPPDSSDPRQTLRKWVEEQKLGGVPTAVSLGGSRVLYQHIRKEAEDPRRPEQVAAIEAVRFRDMTDAMMVHCATPASPDPAERRILITLARPDLLDAALLPVSQSGLRVINACPAPVALYNGVVGLGEPIHQPTLFVDLGATNTEVVIGDGRGILFARTFAMGTALLTQAVATHTRTPMRQAERERIRATSFDHLPEGAARACTQFVQRWSDELLSCVQMFQSQCTQDEPALNKIILSGGGSLWDPLRNALIEAAPLRMVPAGRIAGQEQVQSAEFMIAAGLAAQALGIDRAPSSLLPESIRQGLVRERNKRYWALTGGFSVAAMGMLLASTQISFKREQEQLNRQNDTLRRCEQLAREIEAVKTRMVQMDTMTQPLIRFVNNSARVRELTLFIGANKGRQDFITLIADSESYLNLRVNPQTTGNRRDVPQLSLSQRKAASEQAGQLRTSRMNRLIVEGFTPQGNLRTVKDLIEKLRTHPSVEKADLITDDMVFTDPERDQEWQSTRARRFVLDVQLVNPTPGEEG